MVIKPTVGRVVWFYPYSHEDFPKQPNQPLAAMVACVWSDTCVNLVVFDANGYPHSKASVFLYQGDGDKPDSGYCEWMPYQKGQAAKAEDLEKKLGI